MLELDEDSASQVVKRASFVHPEGEIWQLAAHPDHATGLFATRFSSVGTDGAQKTGAAVWKCPPEGEGLSDPVCRVPGELSFVSWSPASSQSRLMVLYENQVIAKIMAVTQIF